MSERIPNVGLVGANVEDSLSPILHNAAYEAMGIADDFFYDILPVRGSIVPGMDTRNYFRAYLPEKAHDGVVGLSVTAPYKEDIFRVGGQVHTTSKAVEKIGAVNTLIFSNEKWIAENTDWIGVLKALEEADVEIEGKRAVVVGTGGAAKATVYSLAVRGAEEVTIVGRNINNARSIARDYRDMFPGSVFRPALLSELNDGNPDNIPVLEKAAIVINASMAGQAGTEAEGILPVNVARLAPDTAVMDIVYSPLETPLIVAAQERKDLLVIQGTRMLLHQAAEQVELFTGEWDVPLDAMEEAIQ